jgi:hypothetical protein
VPVPCDHGPNYDQCGWCHICCLMHEDSERAREYRLFWGAPLRPLEPVRSPSPAAGTQAPRTPCRKLGEPTGELVRCPDCKGHVEVRVFVCHGSFGKTTLAKDLRQDPAASALGVRGCCANGECPEYEPKA